MHPKDTPSNKSLQAKLFFHAAAAARAFGRIKEIRLGLLSAPHSFEAWPDAEATTVGGNSDSYVRGLVNEIEKLTLEVLKKNATSFMASEHVARAEASQLHEVSILQTTTTTTSAAAGPPRVEAKASSWKPALPASPPIPSPTITTRQVEVVERQRETSASAAAAAPESYHIPLPGCGRRELTHMSRKATGVLRHRPVAKQYSDGMIPLRTFCENYDNRRSPSSCLTMMVLGSDKVRFQIRVTRPVNVSFFEHLRNYGEIQLENEFKKIINHISHVGAVQGHTFQTDLDRHRDLPEKFTCCTTEPRRPLGRKSLAILEGWYLAATARGERSLIFLPVHPGMLV